jgi:hypothetical protein
MLTKLASAIARLCNPAEWSVDRIIAVIYAGLWILTGAMFIAVLLAIIANLLT